MKVWDLKPNDKFSTFAKSDSFQILDIITWMRSNTDIDFLIVLHYSLGEKGEARASMIIPFFIPVGNYALYGAHYKTKIEKYSAFTFQASVFDIQKKERIMSYNFPGFVNPDAAVDVFVTRTPDMKTKTKIFYEILSQLFDLKK
jgi:hypothetical protein